MSEAIFVEGLTKAYAGKTVVDHLDLSVKSGTVFGLLGANGAGKSTTIEYICTICNKKEEPVKAPQRYVISKSCFYVPVRADYIQVWPGVLPSAQPD